MNRVRLTPERRAELAKVRREKVQAARRNMEQEMTRNKRQAGLMYLWRGNAPDEDVAARLAEIPNDTRGLTARICGDPLPGRSALDRGSST